MSQVHLGLAHPTIFAGHTPVRPTPATFTAQHTSRNPLRGNKPGPRRIGSDSHRNGYSPFLEYISLIHTTTLLGAFALMVAAASGCMAVQPSTASTGSHASVELVFSHTTFKPGDTTTMGIKFKIEKGWHLYWNGQNDTGSSPTLRLTSSNPELVFGPVKWPVPVRHVSPGDITDHIYENEFIALVPVTIPATASAANAVSITLASKYLVCSNVCLPGEASVSALLTVGEGKVGPGEAELKAAATKLAEPFKQGESPFTAKVSGTVLAVTPTAPTTLKAIAFFPGPGCTEVDDLTGTCAAEAKAGTLAPLTVRMTPNQKESAARARGIVECTDSNGVKRWYEIDVRAQATDQGPILPPGGSGSGREPSRR